MGCDPKCFKNRIPENFETLLGASIFGIASECPAIAAAGTQIIRRSVLRQRQIQGCQVGLFEAKYDKFDPFLMVGLEILENLFSSLPFLSLGLFNGWPFFLNVFLVKSKIWPFLKQFLAFFSYKLLASLVTNHACVERASRVRTQLRSSSVVTHQANESL